MQRVFFLLVLFLLSAVVVGQVTALNGKIAFETNRDDNHEIYVMDPNGGNLRNLTRNPASDFEPDWSPDGRKIAFTSNRSKPEIPVGDTLPPFVPLQEDIFVMDASGGNVRNLTRNPSLDSAPDWSPDGKQILFLSNRDGEMNTYVMDADGQNVRKLTDGEFVEAPTWSPDGEHIVFEGALGGGRGIYVMNANGRNIHPVSLSEPGFRQGHPEWSPNGKQILYLAWKDGKTVNATLMLATRVRGDLWKSEPVPVPDMYALNTLCWSPDGEHLLVGGSPKKGHSYQIQRYTFQTGELVQLTHPPGGAILGDWSAHALSVSLEGSIATYWGQIKAEGKQ